MAMLASGQGETMGKPVQSSSVVAAATAPPRQRAAAGNLVRGRIKTLATELFRRFGYNGVTFIDIERELEIRHSLIHYHFGNKPVLAEEVLRDFTEAGIEELLEIWGAEDKTLLNKFVMGRDRLYKTLIRYNPDGLIEHAPGLLSRFSLEFESITPSMQAYVLEAQRRLQEIVFRAIEIAIERGELRQTAPKDLLALQIAAAFFVPGPAAHYGWSFNRVNDLLQSIYLTITRAFGTPISKGAPWPPLPKRMRSSHRRGARGGEI